MADTSNKLIVFVCNKKSLKILDKMFILSTLHMELLLTVSVAVFFRNCYGSRLNIIWIKVLQTN